MYIVQAIGEMVKLARMANLNREVLYRSFSKHVNTNLSVILEGGAPSVQKLVRSISELIEF